MMMLMNLLQDVDQRSLHAHHSSRTNLGLWTSVCQQQLRLHGLLVYHSQQLPGPFHLYFPLPFVR